MSAMGAVTEQSVAARLERLPIAPWHVKMRVLLGVATFFDGFDALAIAYVLPVLLGTWHFSPQQIGPLISIGFAGQAIGAIFFGWVAERIGRVKTANITITIFAVMAVVCATAQSYDQLFWYRFVQGLGLGGEVPVAAAYINEIANAQRRGRFVLFYEILFAVGLAAVALIATWIVPLYGWQWLFIVGAIPAIVILPIQRLCPESPRWLASKGRLEEADRVLSRIEAEISRNGAVPLPPIPALGVAPAQRPTRWVELFERRYRGRTIVVWLLWACSYLVNYGLAAWLPTLYRTVYKLPVQDALNYGLLANVAGLIGTMACAFAVDQIGRKPTFAAALLLSSVTLLVLWITGAGSLPLVVTLASVAYFFNSMLAVGLYVYTPEIYPTRMRALGASCATFWLRLASFVGPFVVGFILTGIGIAGVFLFFAIVAAIGGITAAAGMIETRGKVLEDISP